jgi:hypothetical protein
MKHREFTARTELKSLTRSIECVETECGDLELLSECLGYSSMRLGGPFYSPKAARSRWKPTRKANLAFCRVAHQIVRCTTGQPLFMSGARFPSIPGAADRCNSRLVGAPDTVRCTPDSPVHTRQSGAPSRLLARATRRPRIARPTVAL